MLFLLLILGICIFSDVPVFGPQKPEKPPEPTPTWDAFKRHLAADAKAREDRFYEKYPEEKAKRHSSSGGGSSSGYDDDDIDGSGFTGNPMGF